MCISRLFDFVTKDSMEKSMQIRPSIVNGKI